LREERKIRIICDKIRGLMIGVPDQYKVHFDLSLISPEVRIIMASGASSNEFKFTNINTLLESIDGMIELIATMIVRKEERKTRFATVESQIRPFLTPRQEFGLSSIKLN